MHITPIDHVLPVFKSPQPLGRTLALFSQVPNTDPMVDRETVAIFRRFNIETSEALADLEI